MNKQDAGSRIPTEDVAATDSYSTGTGTVFFLTADSELGEIEIQIDGANQGSLANQTTHPSQSTSCDPAANPASSSVEFPAGQHTYSLKSSRGFTWSGSVKVGPTCSVVRFGRYNATVPPGWGTIVFLNPAAGDIKAQVTLDGTYIGTTNTGGQDPAQPTGDYCHRYWVIAAAKPSGSYPYSAVSASGKQWTGSVANPGNGACTYVSLN